MGYRIALDYSGTVSGKTMVFNWQQEVELVGYDLPAFYFTRSFIPVFEWYVVFTALVLIGTPTILMAMRKK